jgi:tetratricopeptide (TPR) repeat protein
VVNPFTENKYQYKFTIDLPEFHQAKDQIHKRNYFFIPLPVDSWEAAIGSLTRASDIISHSRGPSHEIVLHTREMLSRLYMDVEKYEEALKLSMEVLRLTEKNTDELEKHMKAYEHAVECYKMLGKMDEAVGLAGAASIICREKKKWREYASFLLEIGSLFLATGNLEEALKNINLAAQAMEQHGVKGPHIEGRKSLVRD